MGIRAGKVSEWAAFPVSSACSVQPVPEHGWFSVMQAAGLLHFLWQSISQPIRPFPYSAYLFSSLLHSVIYWMTWIQNFPSLSPIQNWTQASLQDWDKWLNSVWETLKRRSRAWHVDTFTGEGYLESKGQGFEMHVMMSHRLCLENAQKAVTVTLIHFPLRHSPPGVWK